MPKGVYERPSLEARILERVSKNEETGCWVWTGRLDQDGYGQISDGKRTRTAHRCMYEIKKGPFPPGLMAGHLCDEKYPKDCKLYRKCCNPDHIQPMTAKENLSRASTLGRVIATAGSFTSQGSSGENNKNAKATSAQVIEIRSKKMAGLGYGGLKELAKDYPDISYVTIQAILGRKDYRKDDKPPGWDAWFDSNK